MGIKDVLAANLKALMREHPRLERLPDITAASNGRLSNGKLDRIRRAAAATDVDTLEELAGVFGLEAWQLLSPSLRVNYTKTGLPQAQEVVAWPFKTLSPSAWLAVSEEVRAAAERMLLSSVPPTAASDVGVRIDPRFSEELEQLSKAAEETYGKPSRKRNSSSKG